MSLRLPALSAALLVAIAAPAAFAGTSVPVGENLTNAVSACQSALPVYEGLFRKRPLVLLNEGTTAAFASCSLTAPTRYGGNVGTRGGELVIVNTTAEAQSVTCTIVAGGSFSGTPKYFVKTVDVAANGRSSVVVNAQTDNEGVLFNPYTVMNGSCNLPAGTGIASTFVWWDEEAPATTPTR